MPVKSVCRFALVAAVVALLEVAGAQIVVAQNGLSDADTVAIQRTVTQFFDAFNRHDAAAVAMSFLDTGDFINTFGEIDHGRKAIEDHFTSRMQGTGILREARRTFSVKQVHAVTETTATLYLESVMTHVKAADGSEEAPIKMLHMAVLNKQSNRWVLVIMQEFIPFTAPTAPSAGR